MVRKVMRVETVLSVPEALTAADTLAKKHAADGAASPLSTLTEVDWPTFSNTVSMAMAKHQEAEGYKLKMEQAYNERDMHMKTINNTLSLSRQLLKAVHASNPKRLGEWGFKVHSTPKNKTKEE